MAQEVAEEDMSGADRVAQPNAIPAGLATTAEVVAIFGPTASGKSAVAEAAAALLETEVVSADALQVYRGIPIITNQPERPTRLVAIRGLEEEMSVGAYADLAHAEIDALVAGNGSAVVCGGTGLYLRAALADLAVPPPAAPGVREAIEREYDSNPSATHDRLSEIDPEAALRIHANDRRRVVRALELARDGRSLLATHDALWSPIMRRPTIVIGLEVPAATLEQRIVVRARAMIAAGAVGEARRAVAGPISRTAEKALGLTELAALPEDEALARLIVRTRRYAAYQRKWMRRVRGIRLVDGTKPAEEIAGAIVEMLDARVPRPQSLTAPA